MNKLMLVLAAALVALLLLVNHQSQKLDTAAADARTAANMIDELQQDVAQRIATAGVLAGALEDERQSSKKLQEGRATSTALLASRAQQIKELKRENEQFKAWVDQLLPADVRRVRERPAIVGAAAYRAWLSSGSAVRSSSDQPQE